MARGNGIPKMTQSGAKYPASGAKLGPGRPVGPKARGYSNKTKNIQIPMSKQPMPRKKSK